MKKTDMKKTNGKKKNNYDKIIKKVNQNLCQFEKRLNAIKKAIEKV